ncbi:MAG: phosphate/phosphite/phosphonate ABC transporter substrate-binding protein [Anaerolineae bacterium]|nr:phosphate/phosphite/phosphonate ABC transporter substrate-binding protein [Anaerolineae bacterium]
MRKLLFIVMTGLVVLSLLVSACARATPTPTPIPPTPTPVPPSPVPPKLTVGQVTDMGGIDDKSFNATAWKGIQDAMAQLGVEGKYLESQQQADYAKNIQQFVGEKLDLIVTVGFLLGVDTAKAALANPEQKFAIVDYSYPDCWPGAEPGKDCGADKELPNVLGLTFATDEAAFLAGYLAAGMSQTGKVGTFGGIKIPPVTIFMKGFEAGVKYYNLKHGTSVEVLGWDTATDEGLFTGNFESTDDGRRFAESLMDEGADVILPVAGPVGLGSAAACKERGTMLIGVDTDWYISAPEFKETYLTSILKNMDVAVFDAIKAVADGTFKGGVYLGTLKNNGVGIAPFHEFEAKVPADLKAEIEQARKDLIAGKITVDGVLAGEVKPAVVLKVGQVTDMGGIDDKSFNATAWKGIQDAMAQLGVEGKYLESQQQADYAKNIQQFVGEKLDLIVTVGFLLGVDTAKAALANPEQKFAIVDYSYPDCWPGAEPVKDCGADKELPNVLGLTFATDEAAFLAGYLAAGMSQTGKVGTFGGIKIPPVTIFMKGFEAGVKYYNLKHGTSVEVLGWDTATDEGLFTGNFESTDDGRRFAESLMDEGADVILPVAGPVGLGSAAACKERGTMLIGVDTDWYISAPEFKETYLTSILKNMDVAVFDAIKAVADGTFKGGVYLGTLKNNGVGIAPFHEFEAKVPADLKAEIEQARKDLIAGKITVDDVLAGKVISKPAPGELGSAEKPIKVLFVPSVDVGMIVSGGEIMRKALTEATGLEFEVSVPTSYAATIEAMCASPDDTIGFIPAMGYVIANQKCGVEVGAAAVRYGWSVYWAQFLVPRDSKYKTLQDLAGKKWAVPDLASTSGYLYPKVMFQEAGVEPGEVVEAGGHPQAALAVYNGEVDFATTYFSPPLTDPRWQPGDDPEPYNPFAVALNEQGKAYAGDVRVLDARVAVLATAPDIFQKVRIMMLTDPIPNDTMSFGPDFPEELRDRIIDALAEFMTTEACLQSICSEGFYNWTGVERISDAAYDVIRRLMAGLGYTEEDVFGG